MTFFVHTHFGQECQVAADKFGSQPSAPRTQQD